MLVSGSTEYVCVWWGGGGGGCESMTWHTVIDSLECAVPLGM